MSASGDGLVEFVAMMRLMRERCAWKAGQTHRSLVRYLLEETYETLEAIEDGDPEHLCEELGDLLLQVYFHAAIAEENGEFSIDDVIDGLTDKMVRRNPHVFGETAGRRLTIEEIEDGWQAAKAGEKSERTSVWDGIPTALPALSYADKVLSRVGHDIADEPDPADRPLGERLLALVAEARRDGLDAEQELRIAVRALRDGVTAPPVE
ncbi:MAG: MazG family protein [Nocardioides sp.]|uniref:MazG family protein n=1 Tax=Nocardioides sp. TaxID=35761 RepID=UPI0039E69FCA